jgi:hypothetical protein
VLELTRGVVPVNRNIHTTVDRWKARGEKLLPPLPVERRQEFIASLHSSMAEDIECLYSLCNGMVDGEADSNWFFLWPLETCFAKRSSWPHGSFPFADGFIDSHVYFLQPSGDHSYRVCATCGVEDSTVLAESLDDAFGLLLRAPEKLLLPV